MNVPDLSCVCLMVVKGQKARACVGMASAPAPIDSLPVQRERERERERARDKTEKSREGLGKGFGPWGRCDKSSQLTKVWFIVDF